MYYVYIIKSISSPNRIYVGYTTNIEQRLENHNAGGSFSTADFCPWKLVTYLVFDDIKKAKDFENYLKSHSGRIFTKKRLV
jgi:putative endonuclease